MMCYDRNERQLTNLDNSNLALPSVQVQAKVTTTNGCHVSLVFPGKESPRIHHEIAGMLIAAFVKKGATIMQRVLCLYSVSTKGQVDQNTDGIPMQRRECLAFIDRMED